MKKMITSDEILILCKEKKIKTCIFDFDYTLTTQESSSSIGIFNNLINSSYKRKKMILDMITKYVKLKFVYRIVWISKLKLLNKYKYKKYLNNIEISKKFIPNEIMLSLINNIKKLNINIIIYSSGLKSIIELFLIQNNLHNNMIKIIANDPEDMNKIITPFKKSLNIDSECICFGDKAKDLKIVKNCINILVDENNFYIK